MKGKRNRWLLDGGVEGFFFVAMLRWQIKLKISLTYCSTTRLTIRRPRKIGAESAMFRL